MFDDGSAGLAEEPFVSGVPEMIDELVASLAGARQGFRLQFSSAAFPGYQRTLTRLWEEFGACWYRRHDPAAEGWLCPALYRYFEDPPQRDLC